ncbi:hypothetical protein [Novosphingobium sp.]|uniref:hypothetical protein n=1 Tax=Novosphingobium sp. TaxID=1874826 RepID=UPI00286E62D8|nr:hypothetical protein [Novosphingobium sp.]
MARAASNIEVHLRRLATAKPRIAKLKRGELLSSMPMAEMLGVRWPALRDWCGDIEGFEASGAFERGGNGVEWKFDPRKVHAFLTNHFAKRVKQQAVKSAKLTKAVGVTMSPDEAAPSLAETKDLVNLTLAVTAAQEKQGYFIPAHQVSDFIAGYNEAVVSGILGTRTKVDPNGNLPVAVRKALDEHLRSLATAVHALAQKFIGDCGARSEQGGTGRAG